MVTPFLWIFGVMMLSGGFLSGTSQTASAKWEVRYAQWRSVFPEGRERGWMPHWTVHIRRDEPLEVDIFEDDGKAIGLVFLGRRIRLPSPMPRYWHITLEFQATCSLDNRSGGWWLCFLPVEAWERLSNHPFRALPEDEVMRLALLRWAIKASRGADVVHWRFWVSPNLTPFLRDYEGHEIVLAFAFLGFHIGAVERGRLRDVRIVIGAKLPRRFRHARWPPKTRRTLRTGAEIALARRRCRQTPLGRRWLRQLLERVRPWMALPEGKLLGLIPSPEVPRAFNVSVKGCPRHGTAVYRFGPYPWRLSFPEPFRLICPVGGESYPGNDFLAYYRGGFKDERYLEGRFVDDGWGWVGPDGERYWFVAYACHWWWRRFLIPGVLNLSRVYLLTGDRRYARRAALLLYGIAKVYPMMDYATQSRYGWLMRGTYPGKIVNHIWETGLVQCLAEAYDNLFDALDDPALESLTGMDGRRLRAFIEANILEEAMDGILEGRIVGNYGMHQVTLATLLAVRQTAPLKPFLDFLLYRTVSDPRYEGVHYALFNLVYKDGMPYESSPGYCFLWVQKLVALAELLRRTGYDLYRHPKMKRLLDAPLEMVCLGVFTPAIGDSGGLRSRRICDDEKVYRAAFRAYKDPRYANHLRRISGGRLNPSRDFEALFERPLFALPKRHNHPVPQSRILDGYGLVILNDTTDSVAVSCYYGVRGGHGHFDQLTIELFAYGQKLLPDLGYPDFMNPFVPGIFTWSKNTISHCTVVVDASRQLLNRGGFVDCFVSEGGIHFADIVAYPPYPQVLVYRRALILIEVGHGRAYLVDIFRVRGGRQHDYSLHGPPGKFRIEGANLTPPQGGTLAGEDIPYGHIYDDPVLGAPHYRGRFSGYKGSGFQHLFHVQRLIGAGDWVAEWRTGADPKVGVRIRVLPQEGQTILVADAYSSPIRRQAILKYLIARRVVRKGTLDSTFVAVIEPFRNASFIGGVRRLPLMPSRGAVALVVERKRGVDFIVYSEREGINRQVGKDLMTDGRLAVLTLSPDGTLQRLVLIGGTFLKFKGSRFKGHQGMKGRVVAVMPSENKVTVVLDRPVEQRETSSLTGRYAFFRNEEHRSCYQVAGVEVKGGELTLHLRGADMRTGLVKVIGFDERKGIVRIANAFGAPIIYRGMQLMTEDFRGGWSVVSVNGREIRLRSGEGLKELLRDVDGNGRTEAWLVDIGIGDFFEMPAVIVRKGNGDG